MPGEITQKFIIKTGRLQHRSELGLSGWVVIEYGQHVGVLVTQQEFDEYLDELGFAAIMGCR